MEELISKYEEKDIQSLESAINVKDTFISIPYEYRTERVSYTAIKLDDRCLKWIPKESLSNRIIRVALNKNWSLIDVLPQSILTDEFYKSYIEKYPYGLSHVPKERITHELCECAVERWDEKILKYRECFSRLDDSELILKALKKYPSSELLYPLYAWIKPKLFTEEIVEYGLNREFFSIYGIIPNRFKTEERNKEMVRIGAFNFIPKHMKSPDLCKFAVEFDIKNIRFVPRSLLTEDFVNWASDIDYNVITHLPLKYNTRYACERVIETGNLRFASYIPYSDLCLRLLENSNQDLKDSLVYSFSKGVIDLELATEMVSRQPGCYYDLPEEIREDKDLALLAIEKDPQNLSKVNGKFLSEELCLQTAKREPTVIPNIPYEFLTPKFLWEVVSDNVLSFSYIPKDLLSEKLCDFALDMFRQDQENNYVVVAAIPFRDSVIKAVLEVENPSIANSILGLISYERQTERLVREALNKHPNCIENVNPDLVDFGMCQKVFSYDVNLISHIPNTYITSEMALKAIKHDSQLDCYIPPQIKERSNIFSFSKQLEGILKKSFSFDEIREYYNGKTLNEIPVYSSRPGDLNVQVDIKWDREKQQFVQNDSKKKEKFDLKKNCKLKIS